MKFHIYFLSILIVLVASSMAFAKGERVETKCEVGIDNQIKEHSWHSIYVTLENYYPKRMEVLVTVTRKIQDQPLLKLQQAVTLDSGDKQNKIKLEFSCPPVKKVSGLKYTILVTEKGTNYSLLKYYKRKHHKVIRNQKEIWVGEWMDQDNITVNTSILGQDDEFILCVNAKGSSKIVRAVIENSTSEFNDYIVAQRQVDDLPTNWLMLDGVKLIIMKNPNIDKLQFGGRDRALSNWVKAGGTLILIISEKAEEYKNLKITNLAGIRLNSLATTDNLIEIQPNSKNIKTRNIPLDGQYQCIDADIIYPELTLTKYWGVIGKDSKTKKIPLVNVTWVGSGKIVSVLIDIQSSLKEKISSYINLEIVEPIFCKIEKEQRDSGTDPYSGSYNSGWGNNYNNNPVNIDMQYRFGNLINNIQQAKPIKFGIIAIFIGIYMIVIAFVDFILLKFISLLHWTWLSVLIWVIAFSLIADKIGETFRGGEMSQREIAVVDSGGMGGFTKYNQFAGVFSQQNQSYTVYHENPDSGITRLERIVSQEFDDDYDYEYGNNYNRTLNEPLNNRSVDEKTEYLIAQPSDVDKLNYEGSYLKSVILPRWVIRDIQAKSLIENTRKQGLTVNMADKIGYYDRNNDIYSDQEFAYQGGRNSIEVYKLTIQNNYPYPISGICVVYSGGKISTYDGIIGTNKAVEFYYSEEQDILLNSNPAKTNYYNNDKEADNLALREIVGNSDVDRLKGLITSKTEQVSIYPETRNEINIPREAFLTLLASSRKLLTNEFYRTSSENFNYLGIKSNALGSLDISHRIGSGETVIFSWNDWHQHKSLNEKDMKPEQFEKEQSTLEKWKEKSEFKPSRMKIPTLNYHFPSINFENWNPAINRFIVNRHYCKPLSYFRSDK